MSEQAKAVGVSDKMKAKDYITLGIFTVLFFAVVMVCIFASAATVVTFAFGSAIAAIPGGIIYTIKEPKRDRLIQHLFKIQELISLYESKQYNELIRMTSFRVQSVADKVKLKTAIEHLKAQNGASIATVISYAHKEGLCIIDDKLQEFIDNNEYLYWRVSDIAFVEVQNLYKYIEGHMPFSTQHKIKGLEFKNVLIVLHNGGWNNYNFEYLFNRNVGAMLTPAQKRSYPNILRRTQKLFYVCCTRAKDNLVVYYPSPSDEVLEGAVSLFGRDNCIDLDAE